MNTGANFLRQALPAVDDATRLEAFLADYWRRRALALPGALAGLECPLDADELAGIACEEGVDARIVRRTAQGFELEQGPFDAARFADLGERDWTLLVNGVDLYVAGFEPWLDAARFVPDWRLDDVMVSFAAPGGSVGPHLDRYDVFLLQAGGERDWGLGPEPALETRQGEVSDGLLLVRPFEAQQTVRCAEGDGLYVPAGCIHHGVALTPSLTVSIGFRSPTLPALLDGWFDHLLDGLDDTPLELDPTLPARRGELAPATVAAAREILRNALAARLDAPDFSTALGRLLTEPGRGAEIEPPEPRDASWLSAQLSTGATLERAPGVRLLIYPQPEGSSMVFCAGEALPCPASADDLAPLTSLAPLGAGLCAAPQALSLATALYNQGLLRLTEDEH